MSALTLVFVFMLFGRGLVLLQDPNVSVKLMGIAILILPVFAVWSIFVEVRFGINSQRLAKRLQAEGRPSLDLEFRPSGKATKESADREFERVKAELSEDSWQDWFVLGEAYDAAGDRRRARAAIRKAIALANNS